MALKLTSPSPTKFQSDFPVFCCEFACSSFNQELIPLGEDAGKKCFELVWYSGHEISYSIKPYVWVQKSKICVGKGSGNGVMGHLKANFTQVLVPD